MQVRHRRLTIAALVLLALGSGLWWSTRPKIDPRLVGKWISERPEQLAYHALWVVEPSGLLTESYIDDRGEGESRRKYRWSSSADGLELVPAYPGIKGFITDIERLWHRVTKKPTYSTYHILEARPDRLSLRKVAKDFGGTDSERTFIRAADFNWSPIVPGVVAEQNRGTRK